MRRENRGQREEPSPPKSSGEALQRARAEAGVALHTVAIRARVSVREAGRWEADTRQPTDQQARRLFGLLPVFERYWTMLERKEGDAMQIATSGSNGHGRASASERLAWAKEILRKEPDHPISGPSGLLDAMVKRFGEGASVEALHRVRVELREEKAKEEHLLTASLGERAAAALRSLAMPPAAADVPAADKPAADHPPPKPKPAPTPPPARLTAPNPPTGVTPMARPSPDDRSDEAVQARRERWLAIATKHPDWSLKHVQDQCVKEMGAGIAPNAQQTLMAQARGLDDATLKQIKGRVTWNKVQLLLGKRKGSGASNGHATPKPAAAAAMTAARSPAAPPSRRGRIMNSDNALAAIRLLVEAVPGIHTVTVHENGTIDYTMREVIERSGRFKL